MLIFIALVVLSLGSAGCKDEPAQEEQAAHEGHEDHEGSDDHEGHDDDVVELSPEAIERSGIRLGEARAGQQVSSVECPPRSTSTPIDSPM